MIRISVQGQLFDLAEEVSLLTKDDASIGGIASFIGLVRDNSTVADQLTDVASMTLEHYPGMTEKTLARIAEQAVERWSLQGVTIIHRVGELFATDPIVLVLTASHHRQAAFDACQYIMDILKTTAPFWKKESLRDGSFRWVDSRESDSDAAQRWLKDD